ncbi:MutS-related protein [Sphingobacterium yanglingense]|uniref:MutS-like protein n=1 Tax=Sphingobacterium yanglingense TaxID=1437280 RepID=A0A4R6WDS5_9SPHI|nr:DNA mismatch repair protein [Sphingobacterium yanglingense]TDQ77922.1 MutS-like protein [Sphingobacterium yanglingense]
MSFIADKQSLDDLNLTGKYRPNSIYNLFSQVKTTGGEKLLDAMFNNPLTDPDAINRRSAIFVFFQQHPLDFPFCKDKIESAEKYLNDRSESNKILSTVNLLKLNIVHIAVRSEEYLDIIKGVQATLVLLQEMSLYLKKLGDFAQHPYAADFSRLKQTLSRPAIVQLLSASDSPKEDVHIPFLKLNHLHFFFRGTLREELNYFFKVLYELDVFIAVSDVARSKGMSYATAWPASATRFDAVDLHHPALDKAVSNSISLTRDQNVLFLTGANMAGKSTWMKTIGTSMYLAHLGFPIAADRCDFSVLDGIYSSINVPDNLNMGYSHFYAEVLRVKEVALQVSAGKNLLVLFDELFKGTNVKDAYDATLAVSEGFAQYTNCLYVISTHIIEVGDDLQKTCGNIQFKYLPTIMEGAVPRYTYRLQEGITNDKQGMMIIKNERILEIIEGAIV